MRPAIGPHLQRSIDESLEQYRKANPFAVLNNVKQKPPVVEELEKAERPVELVNPQYGYDRDPHKNRTLLQWMVAKATYAPNVSIAKEELRSLLKNNHFIPHLPSTLFDRLKQQLKNRMHELGNVLKELPADANGVDSTFRLPQFMHTCTEGKPQYRASQLTVLPDYLKDELDQALLPPAKVCAPASVNTYGVSLVFDVYGSRYP